MKTKFVLLFVLALFVQVTSAQTFGIKGGVNFANMTFSAVDGDLSPNSITGFHIGPVADFQLKESLYFNTGILFSSKGFKIEYDYENMEGPFSQTIKLNYLEMPLNLAYKFSISEKSKFFIQAGPYLGYALSGKETMEIDGEEETEDVEFGEDGWKRFDYGLGFGAGLEFGQIVTSLNYQLGLANMVDDSGEVTLKNRVFQISITYMFGKKE